MTTTFEPTYRTRPLRELRVIDVMHPGMISCPPETLLPTVARMMATYRVHAIVVHAHEDQTLDAGSWAVVNDTDLVRAALDGELESSTAGQIAAAPVLEIGTTDTLDRAMQLMVENEASHLVVIERHARRPIGVVSTLDVARAVAGLI
jgi:signal-transduction protein with cAMP-binding, CBS, and nucleotidyltransferase domain